LTGDIDYGALSTALTPAQQALMPDAAGVPTIGYGIIPYYNVRCSPRTRRFYLLLISLPIVAW
jgi:hypothetical protein